MSVGCEVASCGVMAIGRCSTCVAAFCGSHQGHRSGMRIVNQCIECTAKAEQAERDHEMRHGRSFFVDGLARRTLLNASVATVDVHRVHREFQTRRFGKSKETITTEPFGRGWLLGVCQWEYTSGFGRSGVDVQEDWMTLLWDNTDPSYMRPVSGTQERGMMTFEGLLAVREDATHGGYEFVSLSFPKILGFGVPKAKPAITNWESLSRRVYDLANLGG